MNRYRKSLRLFVLGLAMMMLASACSKEDTSGIPGDGGPGAGIQTEPANLVFYISHTGTDALFEEKVEEHMKQKHPHLTLEFIRRGEGSQYDDLILTNVFPDIIYEASSLSHAITERDLQYDLRELARAHQFDLQRIEANILAQSQTFGADKLYGLPLTTNKYSLIYNKDLFERFGVDAPVDNMTWDEVYALAQRMTRTEDGVSYQGFTAQANLMIMNNPLKAVPLDPKANKATINNNQYKTIFDNLKRFFEIEGNALLAPARFADGHIAMVVHGNPIIRQFLDAGVNVDLVSPPVYREAPNYGFLPATSSLYITHTSKYKDQAFQIIAELLSDEFQLTYTRLGYPTVLMNPEIQQAFGTDDDRYIGKNVSALYYHQDAPVAEPRAEGLVSVTVNFNAAFQRLLSENLDVNTLLRTLEEETNLAIVQELNK